MAFDLNSKIGNKFTKQQNLYFYYYLMINFYRNRIMIKFSQSPIHIALKTLLETWTGLFYFGFDELGLKTCMNQLPFESIEFQVI